MKSISTRSLSKGFTLVELLIVISIIAILSGIIITNLTASKAKSRDAQRVSDLNQIQLALEQYFDRCGQYPTTITVSANNGCPNDVNLTPPQPINLSYYISKIPQDPSTKANYDYVTNGTPPLDYVLHAVLEGNNPAQQNSYPNANKPSWVTSTCYDSTNATSKDYCVSTK